jgi:hypothetical protein
MRKKPPAAYDLPPEASHQHFLKIPFHSGPPDGLYRGISLMERKSGVYQRFILRPLRHLLHGSQHLFAPFSMEGLLFRVSLFTIVYQLT